MLRMTLFYPDLQEVNLEPVGQLLATTTDVNGTETSSLKVEESMIREEVEEGIPLSRRYSAPNLLASSMDI